MDLSFTLNFGVFPFSPPILRVSYLNPVTPPDSGQGFLSYCQELPWLSFSALKTLNFTLNFVEATPLDEEDASVMYPTWINNAESPLIFLSGPSRLKTLETLQLVYLFFDPVFDSDAQVDRILQKFLHDNLDPNFRAGDTFPSLKVLDLFFRTIGAPEVANPGGMAGEASKNTLSKKLLPSIFGPGGRCEANGWAACVDVGVSVKGGQRHWPL